MARSVAEGKLVPTPKPQTIADGLQGQDHPKARRFRSDNFAIMRSCDTFCSLSSAPGTGCMASETYSGKAPQPIESAVSSSSAVAALLHLFWTLHGTGSDVTKATPLTFSTAGRLGDLTWPVVRDLVDEVVTVSEEEIVAAMRVCYERMKARVRLLLPAA